MNKMIILLVASGACLSACDSRPQINSSSWSCQNILPHVIAMAQNEGARLLEVTNPREQFNSPNNEIRCLAEAVWSHGRGGLSYGARVSPGGSVIIEYRRP